MKDLVDHTLSEWRRGGHVWGQSDCLLSVGDYLAAAGYADVSGRFRGTYSTEDGAQAIMDNHGSARGLIDMTGALRADGEPARGDVVLISGIGALCTGDGYALRLERGVVELNRRFITPDAAWKVVRGESR